MSVPMKLALEICVPMRQCWLEGSNGRSLCHEGSIVMNRFMLVIKGLEAWIWSLSLLPFCSPTTG